MLKVRVIGVLPVCDGLVVQSFGFARFLPIGRPEIAVEYLNRWGIDEIIVVDIGSARRRVGFSKELLEKVAPCCQVPLAVGGGLAGLRQVEEVIRCGADKIVLNTAIVDTPALVRESVAIFGSQCVVASIDVGGGGSEAFVAGATRGSGMAAWDLARRAEDLGVGEILINSVERDGGRQGYDIGLIQKVVSSVSVPVIACGGVGRAAHFAQGIDAGASGVAAANFFQHTEMSVVWAKRWLVDHGFQVRLETAATCAGFHWGEDGRATMLDEFGLEKMRFEYVPEEVI
jgi:cyclase